LIDSKGGDFGCFGLAKVEMVAWKKKKREQAPALQSIVIYGVNYSTN
jgi:hypothetical protein